MTWVKRLILASFLLLLGAFLGSHCGRGKGDGANSSPSGPEQAERTDRAEQVVPPKGGSVEPQQAPKSGSKSLREEPRAAALWNPSGPLTIQLRNTESPSGIGNWEIQILDPSGIRVRTLKGKGTLPKEIVWDSKNEEGTPVPSAHLASYSLRMQAPSGAMTARGAPRRIFSFVDAVLEHRQEDPLKGVEVEFTVRALPFSEVPLRWQLQVLGKKGEVVGSFEGRGLPPMSLIWDGSKYPNVPEFSYSFRAWPRKGESFTLEGGFLPESGPGDPARFADQGLPPPPPARVPSQGKGPPPLPDSLKIPD